MNKSMTSGELFNKICSILKEKNKLPDILDYEIATSHPVPIKTYEVDLKSNLAYGGSKAIYLVLWIEYFSDGKRCVNHIGTFKTLDESNKAMHIMAGLLADFIIEEYAYVNANLDDFTWEGADVHPLDDAGKRLGWGYSCDSMGTALKRKDGLLEKYPQVVIRDNATRKEKIFRYAG